MIALQLIEDNPNSRILYITSVATNLLEFWDKVDALNHVNKYKAAYRMVLNLSNTVNENFCKETGNHNFTVLPVETYIICLRGELSRILANPS